MDLHLKIATSLTHLLEGRFKFAGIKFGLDPVLGLIPWVGDLIALSLSLYLVWVAFHMKLPSHKINEMIKNIIVDLAIGAIPIIGDIGDFFYQSNTKNLQILHDHRKGYIADAEVID